MWRQFETRRDQLHQLSNDCIHNNPHTVCMWTNVRKRERERGGEREREGGRGRERERVRTLSLVITRSLCKLTCKYNMLGIFQLLYH